MQLTKNFTLSEFESKDGAVTPPDALENIKILAKNLQVIRDHFDKPVIINSGYRSPSHNEAVGGAEGSKHLEGKAADIRINGVAPSRLYEVINSLINNGKIQEGGVGLYSTFVHYDIRVWKARW